MGNKADVIWRAVDFRLETNVPRDQFVTFSAAHYRRCRVAFESRRMAGS